MRNITMVDLCKRVQKHVGGEFGGVSHQNIKSLSWHSSLTLLHTHTQTSIWLCYGSFTKSDAGMKVERKCAPYSNCKRDFCSTSTASNTHQ